MSAPTPRPALVVAGVSASIFLLEILLTRLFSVTLFHHFAFAAISIGMLGLAASGVRVALGGAALDPPGRDAAVARACLLFSATTLGAVLLLVRVGLLPSFSWARAATLALVYAVCAVPFYFGGEALALLFTRHRERFAWLYAADLAAAGAAGLLVFPLLRLLGGPAAVVAVALLAASTALVAAGRARRPRWTAVALVALCLGVLAADRPLGLLRLARPKGEAARGRILYEGWNAFSRVAVYDAPLWPWSLGPGYRGPVAPGLHLDIDASAATPVVSTRAGAANEYLRFELTAIGYRAAPEHPRTLVIGAGGGRDVLAALLHGAERVDAVEINPLIVDDVMRGLFREASGGLFDDPRVRVHVADGRSFVRRPGDRYDLIQLSLVDTWAATAAGAFALTENNLYTLEAFREYGERLTPDGVLSLTRWAGGETYRLVVLLHAAARSLGIAEPGRHLAVVQYPDPTGQANVPVTALFRKSAFDAPAAERLRSHVAAAGFEWLHDPLAVVPGRVSEIARARDALAEARRSEDYDLAPPSDDRPFFFYRPHRFLAGIAENPRRLFSDGQYLVSEVLGLALLAGGVTILLPLWRRSRQALHAEAASAVASAPYFLALGVGFMLVEVSLLQRFVLFLGHPTHALTAVLAGLLLGAGGGSALASRLAWTQRAAAAAVAVCVLLGAEPVQRLAFESCRALAFPAKLAITELLVLPLGVALGTLMPLGIARLSARAPALVPWAWGLNGFASVVGACGAALLAMGFGFSLTFHVGAGCYALAALAALLEDRGTAVPTRTASGAA